MMKLFILPILASSLLLANTTFYVGKTYDFAEQDMIEAIQQHIVNNKEKIQKKYEEMKEKTQNNLDNLSPKVVSKPYPAKQNRVFYANTQFINPTDIKDANGKILYSAGYAYDPMEYITLPYSIVFLNASRKEEITWLKKSKMLNSATFRILITDGKYSEATKELGQHVFFANDQILSRMNIKATPSIASQEKSKLKIEEVCLDCDKNE